jgi:hypothetical protein
VSGAVVCPLREVVQRGGVVTAEYQEDSVGVPVIVPGDGLKFLCPSRIPDRKLKI